MAAVNLGCVIDAVTKGPWMVGALRRYRCAPTSSSSHREMLGINLIVPPMLFPLNILPFIMCAHWNDQEIEAATTISSETDRCSIGPPI